VDEQATPTVALFLRLDPGLHSRVKRAAARREESVSAFVRRALSYELQRLRTGKVVAQAIRGETPRQSDSDPQPED
jgi:hypothetical protein